MLRVVGRLLPVVVLVCLAASAQQSFGRGASGPTEIRVGDSYVALAGAWKFAPGDSPRVGGGWLWSSPGFDDSGWTTMDLEPVPGETDAGYGNPSYVKGWEVRGFPNLFGYAWYRLRLHVANPAEPLWLKMPDHVDDSYQIFANSRFVGEFGKFGANGVTCYRSRPLVFELPAPDEHGDLLLAIRFYMEPFVASAGISEDSGGMHQIPLVGQHKEVEAVRRREMTGRVLNVIAPVFMALFILIAAAGTFRIWLLDRPQRTYLWLTLGLLSGAARTPLLVVVLFTYSMTQGVYSASAAALLTGSLVCWIVFWRSWFQIARSRWTEVLIVGCAVVVVLTHVTSNFLLTTQWSGQVALVIRAAGNIGLAFVLFFTLLQGARKDRMGALVALPPVLLLTVSLFSSELLTRFDIRTSYFPFGVQVGVSDVAQVLLVLVVGILVARRFLGSQVSQRLERQAVEQEMEQARELQQHVLIPEPVKSPRFEVEVAYHPARTVGGDFFQTMECADGSLLVVVGDVSGKGVAAAMLVAVLVGTIRTRADETSDPAAILRTLNERLVGRGGGHFATCVAAHLQLDGTMLLANAGHLPPYRNGLALDMEGSLPLGIVSGAEYEVEAVRLEPEDRLVFLTDGVPEARDSTGGLLGFEGLGGLAGRSVEEIAQVAMAYGQEDDITVISVCLRGQAQA